jgi:type IX secretion system PorP/SprF family membrane protein
MKQLYTLVILALCQSVVFGQQDKNISNWYHSNVLYNAGSVATGEEDFGFFTNFRSQWLTIPQPGIGMRTNTLCAEFRVPDGFNGVNNFGIGIVAVNDQTGDAGFMTTNVSVPINYSLQLDKNNRLSIGISPGFYQQSVNRDAQTWESQWNGIDYITANTASVYDSNSVFNIGNFSSAGATAVTGVVDECAAWSRALTTDERSQLYAAGAGLAYPFA